MSKIVALLLLSLSAGTFANPWAAEKPKLVVFIVIDQFRADYLSRFQDRFSNNGFKALIEKGAYFPLGEYDILQSMTGPGHSTVLSGSYPYQSGIPLNDWFDRSTGKGTYCVEDKEFGISPNNFLGTTVGDELKNAGMPSRVVSIALKDRAAVLMGGHRADLALWYDNETRHWGSSRYYLKDGKVPAWIGALNAQTDKLAKCDLATPCGSSLTVAAFEAAMKQYKLGQGSAPDLIAVSFSSHDFAGHQHGPNSTEIEAMTFSEDRAIEDMRNVVSKIVPGGLKNVTFVLTGDHGVAPSPKYLSTTGIPTGRIDETALMNELNATLKKKFGGTSDWISYVVDFNFFINPAALAKSKVPSAKIEAEAKALLNRQPGFAHIFTKTDVETRQLPPAMFERQILKTFYSSRSGDVIGIPKPFFINQTLNSANHMTGYTYDRTVPILFSGFGIKPGLNAGRAEVVDIAPTLSFLLGVIPPALNEGHVLESALIFH